MAKLKPTPNDTPQPEATQAPSAPLVIPPRSASGAMVEEAEPELGGTRRDVEPAPTGEVSPPFYLCVHPDRWAVMGGRVVPFVKRLKGTPGANGVDRDGAGRPVMKLAIAQMEEQGWRVLDWKVDGTSYLRRVRSTGGWVDRWTTVYAGSAEVTFDGDGFRDWLASLVTKGLIKPPPLYVLHRLAGSIERQMDRLRERGNHPERIEGLERDLKVVIDAINDAQNVGSKAAPPTPAAVDDDEPETGDLS